MNNQNPANSADLGSSSMSFAEYMILARRTRMDSCNNVCYPLTGLAEETGELFTHLMRHIRFDEASNLCISAKNSVEQMKALGESFQFIAKAVRHELTVPPIYLELTTLSPDSLDNLKSEVGDILWMLSELSQQLGFSLDEAAKYNIQKLAKRAAEKLIDGSGDTESERKAFN